ncbi:CaiB/BaiF CoA transferase family protein [Fretibacter rubidus]|uniref:CaiB/BaiF CoA transferase family protein n=1 Tax=Fretibacter rubidus TaxID=570162 RepID=UPI00352B4E3D
MKRPTGKLGGIKVLDLSAFLPGPHMSMMMADHGADVVMVEADNGRGEPTRHMGETYEDGTSVWFTNIARGKRSYKVNLKDTAQHGDFMTLAAEADVFIEAFRPSVVTRLGVDYDAIKAVNPGVVYCSISAFGQDGHYRDKPAHDLIIQAMAGTADLTRGMDGTPALTPMPSADMAASLHALSGIMMALYRRTQTGMGDYLDISMYDSLLSWVPNVTGAVFAHDKQPKREEMRSFGGNAFVNIYETKDGGHIVLGGSEPKFVTNVLTALGAPQLIEAMKKPVGQQDVVKDFLSKTFLLKTQSDWENIFKNIDCCWSTIRRLHTALTEPHAPLVKDDTGKSHIKNPIRFASEPAQLSFDLPEFGQHNDDLKGGF